MHLYSHSEMHTEFVVGDVFNNNVSCEIKAVYKMTYAPISTSIYCFTIYIISSALCFIHRMWLLPNDFFMYKWAF